MPCFFFLEIGFDETKRDSFFMRFNYQGEKVNSKRLELFQNTVSAQVWDVLLDANIYQSFFFFFCRHARFAICFYCVEKYISLMQNVKYMRQRNWWNAGKLKKKTTHVKTKVWLNGFWKWPFFSLFQWKKRCSVPRHELTCFLNI